MFYDSYFDVCSRRISSVSFDILSSEEVRNLSCVQIVSPLALDALGHQISGGLYDTRLGPCGFKSEPCGTCLENFSSCTGHFGHVELPLPIFNPVTFATVVSILKASCATCHHFTTAEEKKILLAAQIRLIDAGFIIEAQDLDNFLEHNSDFQPQEVKQKLDDLFKKLLENDKVWNDPCKDADLIRKTYLDALLSKAESKNCPLCNSPIRKVACLRYQVAITIPAQNKGHKRRTILTAAAARDRLRNLWKNESDMLTSLLPALRRRDLEYPTDLCFLSNFLITPTITRPPQFINGKMVEHAKNAIYKYIFSNILEVEALLRVLNEEPDVSKDVLDVVSQCKGESLNDRLHNSWFNMQMTVHSLLDVKFLKYALSNSTRASFVQGGVKQTLEKKQGIIRMNMMGKRVNYFARSVITPDPLIDVDEIGIPEVFAKRLTFPVPVGPRNVAQLRELVKNGPDNYPGANIVEADASSGTNYVSKTSETQRVGLGKTLLSTTSDNAKQKVVHRHLKDGDMLLINRQPSLHRPSIMGHKVRVLKGENTFRLHYANCKAYNADFDGDEMNAHFPQNEIGQCEAAQLAYVGNNYLVPRDGTPLSGLIQDHIVAGVRLTLRGRFFTKVQYQHLVYQALHFLADAPIRLLPPAILKPSKLWSGKQIISTLVINLTPLQKPSINLDSTTKISVKSWIDASHSRSVANKSTHELSDMSEAKIIFRQGELLAGVLDKNHLGATHYGLIHLFHELYGGSHSIRLLGAFSKLFTYYLQMDSFTLGVEDILVTSRANKKRKKIMEDMRKSGHKTAAKMVDFSEEISAKLLQKKLEDSYKKNTDFRMFADKQYKSVLDAYTNDINNACVGSGLLRRFPANNLQLLVQSGAKGSTVNTMQMSCLLGQIELEGKRPPLMISGRSLPCFTPYNTSPEAGGFIASRFMTGLKPSEFFFHCMAGREGLIDTAVKTSRSGYLQRCLVKHLEGLVVHYDMTVRDGDNSLVQFLYGEDGQDVTKSQMLNAKQMPFLLNNIAALHDSEENIQKLKAYKDATNLKKRKKSINKNKMRGKYASKISAFEVFCQHYLEEHKSFDDDSDCQMTGRNKIAATLCHKWNELSRKEKFAYETRSLKLQDPVLSEFPPNLYFGSVSEIMDETLDRFCESKDFSGSKTRFKDAIYYRSLRALCHPGEAIGVLAAQSVGEPSTQMTLNTFHFAGRGEMNVTLGIPRLREILMVASKNIKTPSMEIPFWETIPDLQKKAEKLRKHLSKISVADVLEKVIVKESLVLSEQDCTQYEIDMRFLPKSQYQDITDITPKRILKYVRNEFINKIVALFKKNLRTSYGKVSLTSTQKSSSKNKNDDGEIDDDAADALDPSTNYEINQTKIARDKDSDDSDDEDDNNGNDDADQSKRKAKRSGAGGDYDDERDDDEVVLTDDEDDNLTTLDDGREDIATEDEEANNLVSECSFKECDGVTVKSFNCDEKKRRWCVITVCVSLYYKRLNLSSILYECAQKAIIHEVAGIERAIVYERDGELLLKTQGSYGIPELFKHAHLLDLNRLYSNDIHSVAVTYGIEAANKVIVKEIQDVFKVYGINVDPRHLQLISDYMTFCGTYSPLNRIGMDKCASTLQQMSFESCLTYLKKATIKNARDPIQSPSASLILGQEMRIGAGLIKLFHKR